MRNYFTRLCSYSFCKQDFIILLSVYNLVYFVSWTFANDHLKVCCTTALLAVLVTLLVLVLIHCLKENNERKKQVDIEGSKVVEILRDEYRKIHNLKKKQELLKKAGCPKGKYDEIKVNPKENNLVNTIDFETLKKEVHIDYLNMLSKSKKFKDQPEGM